VMKHFLPSDEIFEDYLHPMLFWGNFLNSQNFIVFFPPFLCRSNS
jgi:hypothetical protein